MRPAWETRAMPVLFIPSSIAESPGPFRKHTVPALCPASSPSAWGEVQAWGLFFRAPWPGQAYCPARSEDLRPSPATNDTSAPQWPPFSVPRAVVSERGKVPKALMCQRKKFYPRSALDHHVTVKFQPTWCAGFRGSLPVTLPSPWLGPFAVRIHRLHPYLLIVWP